MGTAAGQEVPNSALDDLAAADLPGEGEEAGRLTPHGVEQQHVSHPAPLPFRV